MSDWADEAAAKIIFDLATRYPTDGFGRMPCAVIADALRSRITALEAELAAEKAKVAKLREAVEPFKPDDDMVGDMEEDDEECVYVIVRKDDLRRARRIHEETA